MDYVTEDVAASLLPLFEPFADAADPHHPTANGGAAAGLTRLESYDDANYRVADGRGGAYVLKVHNAGDSAAGPAPFEVCGAA
jgi:Ser/Thr protein kinase RdoA (MazF antagonist)